MAWVTAATTGSRAVSGSTHSACCSPYCRRALMARHNFTATETAAVINLAIGSAEEARKLIPTLNVRWQRPKRLVP